MAPPVFGSDNSNRLEAEALNAPAQVGNENVQINNIILPAPPPPQPSSPPILLPYPTLGTLFKGRDTFLATLRTSLTATPGPTAITSAVHGMGGVGKTRAAVEYAWANAGDYTALLLLGAETPDRLNAELAALTGPLRLPEHTATEDSVKTEAALRWLNDNPGWFLILDNIDSAPALAAVHRLLGRLGHGHVVLTSRLGHFPTGIQRLDLDILTPEDAASFLLSATPNRVPTAEDDAIAQTLATELGQLALALEIAAATIDTRPLSLPAYRTLWQGNRARVIGWADRTLTGYHHAVAETWQTSIDQLTPSARILLERLSFLAPEPVPVTLLDVPVPKAPAGDDLHAALDGLTDYSLARRSQDGNTLLIHRLIMDVTRRDLARSGTEKARLTEALAWINAVLVGDPQDVRTWPVFDPLAPHAEAIAAFADTAGIAHPTTRLMNQIGLLWLNKSLPSRAEPLMRRALAIDEASYGKDHPRVAIDLNNLAQLLQDTNRLADAEPLMRRALAIDEARYGKDHPDVAINLNNLAQLLKATNRLAEAEPLMRRAWAIDEASYGKDHPRVAIRLNNLAQLLKATNRLAEAEPLMRRALAIDEARYGKDHPRVAIQLNNLAQLLQATNRLAEAEPPMRRALAIDEASYGRDHPNVARDLNNLARLLQDTDRLAEAEPLMRRMVAILLTFQSDTGHPHPHRDTVLNNYAILLSEMGRTKTEIQAALATAVTQAGLPPPV
jgi:tetratricopeptide (TPR) repeat protein